MNIYPKSVHRDLALLIAGSCTAFFITWLLFHWLIIPKVTVIIDRSYCQSQQWESQVVQVYQTLYRQHPKRLKIQKVVSFNDLGVKGFPDIPQPTTINSLETFGRHNSQLQKQLETQYNPSQVLSCY